MGSILDIKSTGLGSAARKIKHHKVRVPKVSHGVRKLKSKYRKTVRAESKQRVKQTIHRRKVSSRTKKELQRYNKWGDKIS